MKAVQRPILVHQIHCLSASILNLLERTRYEHIHAWLTVGDASTRIQPSPWHSSIWVYYSRRYEYDFSFTS